MSTNQGGTWIENLSLLVEGWLQSCAARSKSPRTVRWYRPRLVEFVAWYARSGREATADDFTVANVEAFLSNLRQRHKWETHPLTPTSADLVSGGYVDGFAWATKFTARKEGEAEDRAAKLKASARITVLYTACGTDSEGYIKEDAANVVPSLIEARTPK